MIGRHEESTKEVPRGTGVGICVFGAQMEDSVTVSNDLLVIQCDEETTIGIVEVGLKALLPLLGVVQLLVGNELSA